MLTTTRDAESKLIDTLNSLVDEAGSWRGVHFRFEQLLDQYRSEYQVQIAVNLVNDLLAAHQGGIFVCWDKCIILLCRHVTRPQLEKAIFQLRYLFMDDPLAYDAAGDENPQFCRVYDLGIEYAEFYQFCKRKLAQSKRSAPEEKGASPAEAEEMPLALRPAGPASATAFTPTRLAHVEHDLNKADLSRVFRRQPVCAVTQDFNARRVFEEYYIHIAHLRQMLHMDTDFLSNRFLFKYLTLILDERMLDLLTLTPARYIDAPLSLNFNLETILSRKFIEFDSSIRPMVKVPIVVEIHIGDVFGDMPAFVAARNILRGLGYKICIDGVTSLSMQQIGREQLGIDLAKLQWNADLESDANRIENRPLLRAIESFGQSRVILSRCDTRQAVSYGLAMGVTLFQGRFLDRLVNPHQKVEN